MVMVNAVTVDTVTVDTVTVDSDTIDTVTVNTVMHAEIILLLYLSSVELGVMDTVFIFIYLYALTVNGSITIYMVGVFVQYSLCIVECRWLSVAIGRTWETGSNKSVFTSKEKQTNTQAPFLVLHSLCTQYYDM